MNAPPDRGDAALTVLSVNAGSSTLKFALHPLCDGTVQRGALSGCIQGLEPGGAPYLQWSDGVDSATKTLAASAGDTFGPALNALQDLLHVRGLERSVVAVAHRVVHGGEHYRSAVRVDEAVLRELATLEPLAPLHQPQNLRGIRAFAQAFATVPQVACFDTAYHATLDAVQSDFALPQALRAQGIRRYGFHGLSYQYVISALQRHSQRAADRVLMAHLGNGASVCAAHQGHSIATSMGFSALDGLMMGTRSGALDPGVLLYLLEQGWDHDRLQSLLYRESGLLGVSGISADMRRLRADSSASATHAVAMFTQRVLREMGAMMSSLQGLDVLAFSGGIGEHDVTLRHDLCSRLAWLGLRLDDAANQRADGRAVTAIHAPDSNIEIWVVPTDEGWVAAREAAALLGL